MKIKNGFVAVIVALGLASGALACKEQSPLESAAEKVDEAVDNITHPGEGPIEEAARKAGKKVDDVKDDLTN